MPARSPPPRPSSASLTVAAAESNESSSHRSHSYRKHYRRRSTNSHTRLASYIPGQEEYKDHSGDSSLSSDMTGSSDLEMDNIHENGWLEDDEETGLTSQERKERRKRKRKQSRLDRRVADGNITTTEEDVAKQTLIRNSLINALLIGLWYGRLPIAVSRC